MAWEQRGNRLYYYRKVRRGGRVASEYVGTGTVAQMGALLDASERAEREDRRVEFRKLRQRHAEEDRLLDELGEMASLLARAALLVGGAHTHKGEWRKRKQRDAMAKARDDPNAPVKTLHAPQGISNPEMQRLRRVLDATSKENPKQQDLEELRKMLNELPDLWKIAGDYANFAVNAILRNGTAQALVRESAEHGLEVLKRELGYDQAPALERLLIENVAICRLQLYDTQAKHASSTREGSIANADYWERRLTRTQARYLKACETLARVRKLSRPAAVQVNIGAQQVNLAQGAGLPAPDGRPRSARALRKAISCAPGLLCELPKMADSTQMCYNSDAFIPAIGGEFDALVSSACPEGR